MTKVIGMTEPQQIPLELRPKDRTDISLGRSMSALALATGELIVANDRPLALELECKPHPGSEVSAFPSAVMPVFTAVFRSERSYVVFTRLPFFATHQDAQMAGAEVVSYHIEAPPANEWGWRISQVAISHLYCCEPESVPPVAADAARGTLTNVAITAKKLQQKEPPVWNWPMRWLTTPRKR